MSQELAERVKLKIGQKVLYPYYTPHITQVEIVTIKDVTLNYNGEIIILTEEKTGYLDLSDIYTETQLYRMFNPDQPSKYKGVWKPAHELAKMAIESNWDSIKTIKLLVDKFGMVITMDLVKDAIEKKKADYEYE